MATTSSTRTRGLNTPPARGRSSVSYSRGDVVWSEAPFSSRLSRPWLIVSNDSHPFDFEEVICLMLTTTSRENAIEITDDVIVDGGFPTQSYINPWVPLTMKRATLNERQATLTDSLVDEAVDELTKYL